MNLCEPVPFLDSEMVLCFDRASEMVYIFLNALHICSPAMLNFEPVCPCFRLLERRLAFAKKRLKY